MDDSIWTAAQAKVIKDIVGIMDRRSAEVRDIGGGMEAQIAEHEKRIDIASDAVRKLWDNLTAATSAIADLRLNVEVQGRQLGTLTKAVCALDAKPSPEAAMHHFFHERLLSDVVKSSPFFSSLSGVELAAFIARFEDLLDARVAGDELLERAPRELEQLHLRLGDRGGAPDAAAEHRDLAQERGGAEPVEEARRPLAGALLQSPDFHAPWRAGFMPCAGNHPPGAVPGQWRVEDKDGVLRCFIADPAAVHRDPEATAKLIAAGPRLAEVVKMLIGCQRPEHTGVGTFCVDCRTNAERALLDAGIKP